MTSSTRRRWFSVLGALCALVVCGCEPVDVSGAWSGRWRTSLGSDGSIDMDLEQDGDGAVTGSVSLGGSLCVPTGDFDGKLDDRRLTGSFGNGVGSVELDGRVQAGDDRIEGDFHVTSGLCDGTKGTFTLSR